jgi:hypothetical protein
MNVEDIYNYYSNSLLPVYSRVTAEKLKKPTQIGIEIENCFSHLAVYYHFKSEGNLINQDEHLKKAIGHLERAVLDCYKLLWLELSIQAKVFDQTGILEHATNGKLDDAIILFEEFKSLSREARRKEIENLNEPSDKRIEFYARAVNKADALHCLLDMKRVRNLKKLSIMYFLKTNIIGFIIGIFAGVAGNYIFSKITTVDQIKAEQQSTISDKIIMPSSSNPSIKKSSTP